jgi:hypothetical protein
MSIKIRAIAGPLVLLGLVMVAIAMVEHYQEVSVQERLPSRVL